MDGIHRHSKLIWRKGIPVAIGAVLLSGCQLLFPANPDNLPALSIKSRFLLTFDDGPSIRRHFNPSRSILKQLANNDVQNGIKAIFFVQTRNRNGGGSVEGKAIIREISTAGHVVGIHSVDPRGHVNHLKLTIEELHKSLGNGKQDIEQHPYYCHLS